RRGGARWRHARRWGESGGTHRTAGGAGRRLPVATGARSSGKQAGGKARATGPDGVEEHRGPGGGASRGAAVAERQADAPWQLQREPVGPCRALGSGNIAGHGVSSITLLSSNRQKVLKFRQTA